MNIIYCWAIDLIVKNGYTTFYVYRHDDAEFYAYAGDVDGDHGIGTLADVVKKYDGVVKNEVSPILFPDADYSSLGLDALQSVLECRLQERRLNPFEL